MSNTEINHHENTQSSSQPPTHESIPSLSDLVLDPKYYSAMLSATDKAPAAPTTGEKSPHEPGSNHPSDTGARHHPKASLADLVLNNVTYDAILASSARNLGLDRNGGYPPSSPDVVRAPPSSPDVAVDTAYTPLVGSSVFRPGDQ